ncbi:hypothetical protein H0W80_02775 [Candidatus Saccharibacteria bacterium]|nr:hypothetical protein [Candidatus Saccharibacteria bacterium]
MKHPSNLAWGVIGAGVVAYEYLCPENETLSAGFDRFLEHRYGRYAAIGIVAIAGAHLLNIYEHFGVQHLDPLHQFATHLDKIKIASELSQMS